MSHVHAAHRRGFTLIELLVVVAIIALLISILLPSLSKARETARMVGCLSIHKQMGMANIMYADANDQWYVPFNTSTSGPNKGAIAGSGGTFWGAYIPFRQNLGLQIGGTGVGAGQTAVPGLVDPSKPSEFIDKGEWYRAFAFNAMGTGVWGTDRAVSRAKVVMPSTKVMGMDATNWYLNGSTQCDPVGQWDLKGDIPSPVSGYVAYRHSEMTNMIMHDGHAATMSKVEAFPVHAQRIVLYDPYKFK